MRAGRGMGGLPVGSWRATLITAVVIVALFVLVIGVASTYGPLRHASFPGHPFPPAGYVVNPFTMPDPNDPRVVWCVEERGSGTNTYFVKSTGQPVRTETVSFDHRIWLVAAGDRYLITDVEVLSPAR